MKKYAVCPFEAKDCFAFDSVTKCCDALEDTKFNPSRGCVFYKTKKQNDAEIAAAKKRNEELGITMEGTK